MKNDIQNIELINQYLRKTLSKKETEDFETRLKTDTSFREEYETHVIFLEGLKRQSLKQEIKKGKQSYIRNKWLRYLGFTSIIVVLLVFVYLNAFNSDKDYLKSKLNFEPEYIQKFQVAMDSVIEIVGGKGTIVRFRPNDLETSSNAPFLGDSLTVELIELTSKQDLLLANTQTVSNGKWLISGGAFKIDIRANGESLMLKEDKAINVKFPKNTTEDGMELFYGKTNEAGAMNWNVSNIKLEEEMYYTIVFRDSFFLDMELSKRYRVDLVSDIIVSDTLGQLKLKDVKTKFPELESIKTDNDTLRVYGRYVVDEESEIDTLLGEGLATKFKFISIPKTSAQKLIDDVTNRAKYSNEYNKAWDSFSTVINGFYKSVEISKLGWINIDKFAPDEAKVSIKLNYNLKTSYNQIYVVDQRENTILDVFDNEVDLPINRSFYIIAIGINGKDIYGYKKSVRFNKSGVFKIDYKKINETQLKSILDLNNGHGSSIISDSIPSKEVSKTDILKTKFLKDSIIASNNKETTELTSFDLINKAPQRFVINTKGDTTLICKEKTNLFIKANSFVDSNNKIVKGPIDLKITEYYKISDILLANLSTQSDDKLLETGGMLYIQALRGDEPLKLKPNSTIQITFPSKKKKEGMQLFSGEWINGAMNWTPESFGEETSIEPIEEIKLSKDVEDEEIQVPYAIVEQVPVYPSCENLNNTQGKKCFSDAVRAFIQRNFRIPENLGLTGRVRITSSFRVNRDGDVVNIQSRASSPDLEREANRVIALLPKMQPGKQRGKTVTVPYSFPIILQIDGKSGFVSTINNGVPIGTPVQDSIINKRFEEKLTSKDSVNVSATEVNNYIMRCSSLGWINCDRFIKSKNKIKYKLKIKDYKNTIVSMVFKSMYSVISGLKMNGEFNFKNVPNGENVVLIALKKENDKLYFDFVETKIKENPRLQFNFKQVTLQEIKKELKKLNMMF